MANAAPVEAREARLVSDHAAERGRENRRSAGLRAQCERYMKSATAAADPLDDTPGLRLKSCGLRTPAGTGLANSVVRHLPIITMPARRIRATSAVSIVGLKSL